ncbi:MAG TPA: hypothetical protein VIY48_08900 [Candidatus Paceibacterota bacterium]
MPANIVQAEFFYGDYTQDLNGFMYELGSRIADGAPIKKVVRFYDSDGSVTDLVKAYTEAEEAKEHAVQSEFFARGVWKHYWRFMRKRRFRQLKNCRSAVFAQALECLRQANAHGLILATETLDHHFRRVRDDERHELLESVRAATKVWVFVFKPNNLFTDENTMVARAM